MVNRTLKGVHTNNGWAVKGMLNNKRWAVKGVLFDNAVKVWANAGKMTDNN